MTPNNQSSSSDRSAEQCSNEAIEKRQKEEIAYRLYQHRTLKHQAGTPQDDWQQAENIYKNYLRLNLFRLHTWFINVEQQHIEPTNQWLNRLEIFKIFEKISPVAQTIGVLLIPVVLAGISIYYQVTLERREQQRLQETAMRAEERLQDAKIFQYLNQLSTILLELDSIQLRTDENAEIRALARATTLTLLRDENFGGGRKGQVIEFLSEMNLIQRTPDNPKTEDINESLIPIILLIDADLSNANLSEAVLNFADLRLVDLSNADLSGAILSNALLSITRLSNANLSSTNLSNADLFNANLSNASLRNADLSDTNLSNANLFNANLGDANLSNANLFNALLSGTTLNDVVLYNASLRNANLSNANLSNAELSSADLSNAILSNAILLATNFRSSENLTASQLAKENQPYLCNVALPSNITDIDPDRDCDKIPQEMANRYQELSLERAKQIVDAAKAKTWD